MRISDWSSDVCSSDLVPTVITRTTAFLVDFLPIIRRTLTRTGFVIDHIHYYADALKPWIARRDRLPAFLIRRDPRDISRIRSEERRVGKEGVSTCRSRRSPYN